MKYEDMVQTYPRSSKIVVYPNSHARYDAIVVSHTPTMLRVRVLTEAVKKYRGEYANVKPNNVIPAP